MGYSLYEIHQMPIAQEHNIKFELREYEKFKYLKFSYQQFEKSTWRVRRAPDLQMVLK